MDANEKTDKIIEARMKLKRRFEEKMAQTPSLSDRIDGPEKPRGTGPANRHGMPAVPVGQTVTTKWPVLDLGYQPAIPLDKWQLNIDGEVNNPVRLKWDDLMALPQVEDTSDFHCVTTWSRLNVPWVGVRFMDLAALVDPKGSATHVMCYGYDGYCTNVALEEALKPDVLLVHTADGKPLTREHGGPLRMITPRMPGRDRSGLNGLNFWLKTSSVSGRNAVIPTRPTPGGMIGIVDVETWRPHRRTGNPLRLYITTQ